MPIMLQSQVESVLPVPGAWLRWLPVLILIDILFLPRLLFAFGIPSSLLIIFFCILHEGVPARKLMFLLVLMASLLASIAFGAASGRNLLPIESLKRAFQLMTILFYAFYQFGIDGIRSALVKVFRVFYLYIFSACILFYYLPETYERGLTLIYPEAMDSLASNLEHFRFSYFFEDPNSAGYFICFTLVAYLRLEYSRWWAFILAVLAGITIVLTQSRGAYIALLLICMNLLFFSRINRRVKVGIFSLIVLALIGFAAAYKDELEVAYSIFETRFTQEEDLGGGRSDKYFYFLQNFNFLPFGSGYHLMRGGVEFRPHSDLIRLNLAYGVLAIPAMMYFFWPRVKAQILLFCVFLIPFLINTAMDDYRLLPMYFLLLTLLGNDQFKGEKKGQSILKLQYGGS